MYLPYPPTFYWVLTGEIGSARLRDRGIASLESARVRPRGRIQPSALARPHTSHLTLHSRARNRSAEAGSKALNNSIFLAAVCRKICKLFLCQTCSMDLERPVHLPDQDQDHPPPVSPSRNKGLEDLGQSSPKAGQRKNGCTDSTSIWNRP